MIHRAVLARRLVAAEPKCGLIEPFTYVSERKPLAVSQAIDFDFPISAAWDFVATRLWYETDLATPLTDIIWSRITGQAEQLFRAGNVFEIMNVFTPTGTVFPNTPKDLPVEAIIPAKSVTQFRVSDQGSAGAQIVRVYMDGYKQPPMAEPGQ